MINNIEIKKDIPFNDDYYASSDGYIFSKRRNKVLKYNITKNGYAIVKLSKNGKPVAYQVHRLILSTFDPISGMENLQVNHKDGNKLNNSLENLEWCTASENMRHAHDVLGITFTGKTNSSYRRISMKSLSNNVYKEFSSISLSAKYISSITDISYMSVYTSIWRVLNKKRKSYLGFTFNYLEG